MEWLISIGVLLLFFGLMFAGCYERLNMRCPNHLCEQSVSRTAYDWKRVPGSNRSVECIKCGRIVTFADSPPEMH